MDFQLSEQDLAVLEMVKKLAVSELAPKAAEIDERSAFATAHVPKLAELGIMGMNLPESAGGAGISPIALFLAVEAMAGACASTASLVTAHFLATDAIHLGGGEALKRRYLPDAAAGRTLGAFALTEPAAGSNPADMRTTAVAEAGGYRLRGVKHFISNAAAADFIVVFALSDPAAGHRGISAFVVERASAGVSVGSAERTMGLKGGHIFEIGLDCVVPEAQRIGLAGSGYRTAMRVLDNGRVEIAAMALGIAAAAFAAALAWTKERRVGGAALAELQGIQWMLADMATEMEAARLLGLRAAWLREQGRPFAKEAAMAKLFASEMAAKVTDLALQIHGGYGYTRALPLERYVRDARILRIFEGSSEIQRNIIARSLLK
ncbi:MAG: acyl-CoA dehydrogenase family protein [Alphaproteobacteria bacterium]